nr:MAG TPA: hypothetical protein [Caudoviricetes sp.]
MKIACVCPRWYQHYYSCIFLLTFVISFFHPLLKFSTIWRITKYCMSPPTLF